MNRTNPTNINIKTDKIYAFLPQNFNPLEISHLEDIDIDALNWFIKNYENNEEKCGSFKDKKNIVLPTKQAITILKKYKNTNILHHHHMVVYFQYRLLCKAYQKKLDILWQIKII
jgi:hypothetical protein